MRKQRSCTDCGTIKVSTCVHCFASCKIRLVEGNTNSTHEDLCGMLSSLQINCKSKFFIGFNENWQKKDVRHRIFATTVVSRIYMDTCVKKSKYWLQPGDFGLVSFGPVLKLHSYIKRSKFDNIITTITIIYFFNVHIPNYYRLTGIVYQCFVPIILGGMCRRTDHYLPNSRIFTFKTTNCKF